MRPNPTTLSIHFEGLANPTRLKIVERLAAAAEVRVSELAEFCKVSQPRMSWHLRILKRARKAGAINDYSDEEFEAIVHILMGARGYLSQHYSYSAKGVTAVPDHVISAYRKLITRGLFNASRENGDER